MATALNSGLRPEWSKPRSILFAAEVPANQNAFAYAVAQAKDFGAELILFHVYDTLAATTSAASGMVYYNYEEAARQEVKHLQPLLEQAKDLGVRSRIVAQPGLPAAQILNAVKELDVDCIVMGTHSPGHIGKLLVGSVAEEVLRNSPVPVMIAGPQALEGSYRNFATRTVLCSVSLTEDCGLVAALAAQVAAHHRAKLILEHVIRPQERRDVLASHNLNEIEGELLRLIPAELQSTVDAQAVVVSGDPTEELLYQSRVQHVDLIVLGAHGATAFAAATRHGVVYKVLAQAQCPVLTLSPTLLGTHCGYGKTTVTETYMAGVI